MSDKTKNFERLAEQRMNKAIAAIRLLGNLASPNYEYTPDHVESLVISLNQEVLQLKEKFEKKPKEVPMFKFGNITRGVDEAVH